MTLLLALNLLSGMRIGWGYEESPLGGMKGTWASILTAIAPKGSMFGINVITLHVTSAFLLLLVASVYVGYLIRSGATRKLKVDRKDIEKLMAGIRGRRFWRSKPALWSANVLVYWLSFVFIAVLTVTGFALYWLDLGIAAALGGYDLMRLLHAVVSYLLIPYTILHGTLQWFFGRFWTIFKVQIWRPHVLAGLVALAVAVPIAAGAYFLDGMPSTLTVPRIAGGLGAPVLDGDPGDPVWAKAKPVIIHTAKATNSPGHVSDITVKRCTTAPTCTSSSSGTTPTSATSARRSIKTAEGWKVLQTAFDRTDESKYYEDKLSMYITNVKNGTCAGDLPPRRRSVRGEEREARPPLHDRAASTGRVALEVRAHEPHGRPAGEPGYADDMYFGPRTRSKQGDRYTGGYYPTRQGCGIQLQLREGRSQEADRGHVRHPQDATARQWRSHER
jgi:thiosulfate reductase cytochrome b subunit